MVCYVPCSRVSFLPSAVSIEGGCCLSMLFPSIATQKCAMTMQRYNMKYPICKSGFPHGGCRPHAGRYGPHPLTPCPPWRRGTNFTLQQPAIYHPQGQYHGAKYVLKSLHSFAIMTTVCPRVATNRTRYGQQHRAKKDPRAMNMERMIKAPCKH